MDLAGLHSKATIYKKNIHLTLILMVYIGNAAFGVDGCNRSFQPRDCAELYNSGCTTNGVYMIWPVSRETENKEVWVYCDMTTAGGGWTVIQRRGNYSRPMDYFYKDWKDYKEGFGNIENSHWLGNDNIFALSNQKRYSLRIDMVDYGRYRKYAEYDSFWIDDEYHFYTLHVTGYSGDAGDSLIAHNYQRFSTRDRDNDQNPRINNAVQHKGAWWYKDGISSNLNGLYLQGHIINADAIHWSTWKGIRESLLATEMKIRPQNFKYSQLPTY